MKNLGLRKYSVIFISMVMLSLALPTQADANVLRDCSDYLAKVSRQVKATVQSIVSPTPEVPLSYEGDYAPDIYEKLDLAQRFLHTYHRIQARHHKSAKTVFFYDYEVRDVINKIKELLVHAREDLEKVRDPQEHIEALAQLKLDIEKYEKLKHIPYADFHATTELFTLFQKYGLKTTVPFVMKPRGRYDPKGYKFSERWTVPFAKNSGFQDKTRQLNWNIIRSNLLRKATKAIFIPTFAELDEEFFIAINSFPVFPAGIFEDVNWVGDGQLYGPVIGNQHDFYHAKWALMYVDYSPEGIAARERRKDAFNTTTDKISDLEHRRLIRILYHYLTHEETKHPFITGEFVQLSRSRDFVKQLLIDSEDFAYIQERIYERPYDFGEMFGDDPPSMEQLLEARQWLSDFFKADTHYP